jgi:disulfide bond formation protein DsbB
MAMFGSLYYSNFGDPVENFNLGVFWVYGYGFDPCLLCVWNRIMQYPIVVISGIGIIKKAKDVHHYILPLSIPAVCLSAYHYMLQKTSIANPFACTGANPCSALSVDYFGFITIPFLALAASTIVTALCIIHWKLNK